MNESTEKNNIGFKMVTEVFPLGEERLKHIENLLEEVLNKLDRLEVRLNILDKPQCNQCLEENIERQTFKQIKTLPPSLPEKYLVLPPNTKEKLEAFLPPELARYVMDFCVQTGETDEELVN